MPLGPWSLAKAAFRANRGPAVVLWAVTAGLVGSYLFLEPVREALSGFTRLRAEHGLASAVVMTVCFAAVLPGIYRRLHPVLRHGESLRKDAWLLAFWAWKGVEIELWFRLLGAWVGTEATVGVVLAKALLDQALFAPFLALPETWVAFSWPKLGFDRRALWKRLSAPGWYRRDILPLLLANVTIWFPVTLLLFTLPVPLQLPVQNLVLCFFTLVASHLAAHDHGGHETARGT